MTDKPFPDETTSNRSEDDPPVGDTVRRFVRATEERLNEGADYIRSQDPKRMMAGLRTVVTDNPGLALIVAAAAGFVLGRAVSRD